MTGWLHTSGKQILNENGQEVWFNGITTQRLWGGNPDTVLKAADIAKMRSHGLNCVRIDLSIQIATTDWNTGQQMPADTPTHINYNSQFWPKLDELVAAAEQAGMWIEFNLFGFPGFDGWPTWTNNGTWSYQPIVYPNTLDGQGTAVRNFFNTDDPTSENMRTLYKTFWQDVAAHFVNKSNVVFNLFNEPLGVAGYQMFPNGDPQIAQLALCYQKLMQDTIDLIQLMDLAKHLIIVQEAYFWYYTSNLKVNRPNVAVECHAYWSGTSQVGNVATFADLGWRYNQPFILGEMGGIEQGLQSEAGAIATIQACNTQNVGWMYLNYRTDGVYPSAQTWLDLQNNLHAGLVYATPPTGPSPPVLTIQPSTNGSTSPAPGAYVMAVGVPQTITATPAQGYILKTWMVDGVDQNLSTLTLTITMNMDHTVLAVFAVTTVNTYVLDIWAMNGGTTSPTGTQTVNSGTQVSITATPNQGYSFNGWLVNNQPASANPLTLTITGPTTVIPQFQTIPTFTLTIIPSVGGKTDLAGAVSVKAGTDTVVKASADQGYVFDHWLFDGQDQTPWFPTSTFTLWNAQANHTLQAVFTVASQVPTTQAGATAFLLVLGGITAGSLVIGLIRGRKRTQRRRK